jgi:hypothetical protein
LSRFAIIAPASNESMWMNDHAVFPHIRAKKPDLDRKLI